MPMTASSDGSHHASRLPADSVPAIRRAVNDEVCPLDLVVPAPSPYRRATLPNGREADEASKALPNSSTTRCGVPTGAATPPKTGTVTS